MDKNNLKKKEYNICEHCYNIDKQCEFCYMRSHFIPKNMNVCVECGKSMNKM
jgi:hypothetical protein